MRAALFTKPTLVAAVELLEQHTQARFNQVIVRLGLILTGLRPSVRFPSPWRTRWPGRSWDRKFPHARI